MLSHIRAGLSKRPLLTGWTSLVALVGTIALAGGCAWGLARVVKIHGVAALSGAASNGSGGILVNISGMQETTTNADGSYEVTGIVNGSDPYVVTFSKSGYTTTSYDGKITLPSDNGNDIDITIPSVTLVAVGAGP